VYTWLTNILKTVGKLGTLKGVLPTLMSLINFGRGTKGVFNLGKDWIEKRKRKLNVDTKDAEDQIKKLEEHMREPLEKPLSIKLDE